MPEQSCHGWLPACHPIVFWMYQSLSLAYSVKTSVNQSRPFSFRDAPVMQMLLNQANIYIPYAMQMLTTKIRRHLIKETATNFQSNYSITMVPS